MANADAASEVTTSQDGNIRFGILLNCIDMNFARITREEDRAFRKLRELLQDRSCDFTQTTLPACLQNTVLDFQLYTNESHNFCDLICQLYVNIWRHMTVQGLEINCHNIPYRYFLLLNELIGDVVDGSPFSLENTENDSDASTVCLSPSGSPNKADSTT